MNSEDFLKLVEMRQSDRDYDRSRKVPEDAIRRIVDAGRLAPSACNSQPWHFVVVTRNDLLEQMSPILNQMNMNKFASSAPCFIVMVQEAIDETTRVYFTYCQEEDAVYFEYKGKSYYYSSGYFKNTFARYVADQKARERVERAGVPDKPSYETRQSNFSNLIRILFGGERQ